MVSLFTPQPRLLLALPKLPMEMLLGRIYYVKLNIALSLTSILDLLLDMSGISVILDHLTTRTIVLSEPSSNC